MALPTTVLVDSVKECRLNKRVRAISVLTLLLSAFLSSEAILAQDARISKPLAVSAGMGVSYVHATDVVDFVNQIAAPSERVGDFGTAVEFFAAPEMSFSSGFGFKLEYAYLLKEYAVTGPLPGQFEFSYSVHMPTAVLFYRLEGDGFFVKFGGGVGYHLGKFTRLDPNSGSESRYTSGGPGFKLELMGNTAFGESLYGLIGGDLRVDFIGELKDNLGRGLEIRRADGKLDPINLRFASLGIKFGIIYYF